MKKLVKKKVSKQEQGEFSRKEIIRVSRKLFGTQGYFKTSIEDILKELKLTKGALYHHFENKKEIFFEVCKEMNEEISSSIEYSTWYDFKKNWKNILDLSQKEEFIRIWIHDCYSVLSLEEVHNLDEKYITQPLQKLIEKAIEDKKIKKNDSREEAQLLVGLFNQTLLVLAMSSDNEKNKIKKKLVLIIERWIKTLE